MKKPFQTFVRVRVDAFGAKFANLSVYQLKAFFRVMLVVILVGGTLAAIAGHSVRVKMYNLRREKAETATGRPQPSLTAENNFPGTFTTFETPGSTAGALQGTVAFSIDAAGDIAGPYLDANRVAHGFLRLASGSIVKFDVPGAGNLPAGPRGNGYGTGLYAKNEGTIPVGINGGVVVGTYADSNLAYHGFFRSVSGIVTEFDVPGAITGSGSQTYEEGTKGIAINASGVITGTWVDANLLYHGFVRSATGTITKFDPPGSTTGGDGGGGASPMAINDAGTIVGMFMDTNQVYHGFIRSASGAFTVFDAPDAVETPYPEEASEYAGTVVLGINDAGMITGTYTDANFVRHGFVRAANGVITEFNAPGAGSAMPPGLGGTELFEGTGGFGINAAGDVAGMYLDANLAYHGFVRFANGEISTFDAPGAVTTTLHGSGAFAINTAGQVAGTYVDANFAAHAFLLTPDTTVAPTFSVASGTYKSTQTVTIADATAGASIYYTLDGTTPSSTSAKYTTPLSIAKTTTVKAIAEAAEYSDSAVSSATYTILLPQTITFTPPASPVSYGVKPITLAAKATSGLPVTFSVVSGPATVSGSTLTITGVGTVMVAANQSGNSSYAPAPQISHTIVVTKATQTITFAAPASPVTYGVKPITLSATASSGLPVTYTVVSGPAKVSGSTLTISGAGTVIVAANQSGNAQYAPAATVDRSISVLKAVLTVTVNDQTMQPGYAVPVLTYIVTGFVNGDLPVVVTGLPVLHTTATTSSKAGTYPITITAGTLKAANYTFTFVNGTLTIPSAPVETVLHIFTGKPGDGQAPNDRLVRDALGNLYGTTLYGGTDNKGLVFELSPVGAGWIETILYSFTGAADGAFPNGGLAIDASDNLYGTTTFGGTGACKTGGNGCGTVFKLSKTASTWTLTSLYSFVYSKSDGAHPYDYSGLAIDKSGNLYGTTSEGGIDNVGTVFELTAPAAKTSAWKETLLYSFGGASGITNLRFSPVLDAHGNLFGVSPIGGASSAKGTVYELSPGNPWTLTLVYSFALNGPAGIVPKGGLVIDSKGNLYGTTSGDGTPQDAVYELSPGNPWKLAALHSFTAKGDGTNPMTGLAMDSHGRLYGTTSSGGTSDLGTVFELTPGSSTWTETILYSFKGGQKDGHTPEFGDTTVDPSGNLYGVTYEGGTKNYGVVFKVVP